MKYHDYHLRGYSVDEFGETIVFDLVYDYPGRPIRQSKVQFSGVALYHFVHTAGSIITDIRSCPIETLLSEYSTQIPKWNQLQSVTDWNGSFAPYKQKLEEKGLSGWKIDSAIGFHGFILAKEIIQKTEPAGSDNLPTLGD